MRTGILFDLDGTLLDTLDDLMDGVNYALNQMGYPARSRQEIRRFVGNGARNLVARSVPAGEDSQMAFDIFKPYYDAHCQIKTCPYEGIMEALAQLGKKYPIAIVSNKPDSAVKSLCADYFPGLYARGERSDCPRKPAPDMVWQTMAETGMDRCIYVGDSEVDVLTARNAGVPCVSVLWGFRDRPEIEEAGGTCFCETPEEMIEKIEELIHGK